MSQIIDEIKKNYIDKAIESLNENIIPSLTGLHFNESELDYFKQQIEKLKQAKTKHIDVFLNDILPSRVIEK